MEHHFEQHLIWSRPNPERALDARIRLYGLSRGATFGGQFGLCKYSPDCLSSGHLVSLDRQGSLVHDRRYVFGIIIQLNRRRRNPIDPTCLDNGVDFMHNVLKEVALVIRHSQLLLAYMGLYI